MNQSTPQPTNERRKDRTRDRMHHPYRFCRFTFFKPFCSPYRHCDFIILAVSTSPLPVLSHAPIHQSLNKRIRPCANQQVNQSIRQSAGESINEATRKSTNRRMQESITDSNNESPNRCIGDRTKRPLHQCVSTYSGIHAGNLGVPTGRSIVGIRYLPLIDIPTGVSILRNGYLRRND